MSLLALFLAAMLHLGPAGAQPLPAALRAVTDEAGVLSTSVSRSLQDLFEKTGVRVLMVVAGTAGPEGMEGYAQRLARRWREERRIDPAQAPERSHA